MTEEEFADPGEMEASDDGVEDDASKAEDAAEVRYDIASFGWDPDAEGLVRKLERGEILIPEFQRGFVWSIRDASRFIESLLLGLPVPGIFLAEEHATGKRQVIDGQQRLKTLQFFFDGRFNPKPGDKRHRVFSLQKVQEPFEGKTYETLDERDRLRLQNSIIPATIVKQLLPSDDDTSIFHIFERLNSGGTKLTAQEIRVAIFHGPFVSALRELNDYGKWRQIFGAPHKRLKDQELILRFLALHYECNYSRPMTDFLSRFMSRHQFASSEFFDDARRLFENVVDVAFEAIGSKAFRLERAINAAVYDSVMVGLARRLETGPKPESQSVKAAYEALLRDEEYVRSVSQSTADEAILKTRIDLATKAFCGL